LKDALAYVVELLAYNEWLVEWDAIAHCHVPAGKSRFSP
jgi:hypothetical protein